MGRQILMILMLIPLSSGCFPHLRSTPRSVQAFTVDQPCSQGPHEIRLDAAGARWEESIEVTAYTPRAIRGHYELLVDDRVFRSGEFGEGRLLPRRRPSESGGNPTLVLETVNDPGPDNARCLASAEAIESAASLAPELSLLTGAAEPVAGLAPSPGEGGEPLLERGPPSLVPAPWDHDSVHLYAEELLIMDVARVDIVDVSWHNDDPEGVALEAGASIVLRLWSVEPNDLEGVRFVIGHAIGIPNVGDARWIERLEERRERALRRDERRSDRRSRHASSRSRRASRQNARRLRRQARLERRGERNSAQRGASAPGHSSATGEVSAAGPPPPPPEPEGPPPPPRSEQRSPRPSEGATWISGYWHWHLGSWLWLDGRWEIPEEDIEQGRTAVAPEAPPPPRLEPPPPAPAAGLVWTPGFWQWDGAVFVWVAGSWRLPPNAASAWTPPMWQPRGARVIFIPGRWSVRSRR